MSKEPVYLDDQFEDDIHLRDLVEKYLRHWKWFAMGVFVSVVVAFFYLKYATPVFRTEASIVIKEEDKGGMGSQLSALQDIGVLGGMGGASVENEIEIMKSKRLLQKVVEELGLNVSYYVEDGIKTNEVYNNIPFYVKVLRYNDQVNLAEVMPEEPYVFSLINDKEVNIDNGEQEQTYQLGSKIILPFAEIMVVPNIVKKKQLMVESNRFLVNFSTIEGAAISLEESIQVSLADKNATVINLALEHPLKRKAQDILNELVNQYNEDAIIDNNLVSKNTAEFIDERLKIIGSELDSVETDKVAFKTENKLTNIEAESELFLENVNEVTKQHLELATQMEVTNTMIAYLKEGDNSKLLPTNLSGQESKGMAELINTYNTLVIEHNEMLKNSSEKNPVVKNINSQIDQLRSTVLNGLETQKTGLRIAMSDLRRQEAVMDNKIAKVPGKEKEFRGIERQQSIKEALYLYLLQKREEASINMAVTAPKAKIVDYANSTIKPVAPKKMIVLGGAFLMGLLIPFLVIYVGDVLNNKIVTRKDIERALPSLPIIGELPSLGDKEDKTIAEDDRSVLAEAFRILRTNLQYMFVNHHKEDGAKTILVTSTTKGEGKSLVSSNLAVTLADTKKKVVLIGADLRNPQLKQYIQHNKRQTGLSNYLYNEDIELDEIINPSGLKSNLDMISSGSIPPNPAELLMGEKIGVFFEELKKRYDYVVIDSAPLLLVTDTFLINKYADVTVYVMRSGYAESKFTDFVADTIKQKKLDKVAMVLNDVSMANFGYGNKYGYNYGGEKDSMLTKIKKVFIRS
ncbi:capsular exopolysaccharide family [Zhouia amylolytica]|uniref:non-specific protein-tyrosine kinase n=1 Tax=Zhouia amylolytica TaxID=376730 RepID=A0A1I6QRH1_9FLAO|nr:tyrosine-protein kinase [Zhouia amylolytica]SFS55053.1 capsular exopolysaccharide family [Zhouia amylolytica]